MFLIKFYSPPLFFVGSGFHDAGCKVIRIHDPGKTSLIRNTAQISVCTYYWPMTMFMPRCEWHCGESAPLQDWRCGPAQQHSCHRDDQQVHDNPLPYRCPTAVEKAAARGAAAADAVIFSGGCRKHFLFLRGSSALKRRIRKQEGKITHKKEKASHFMLWRADCSALMVGGFIYT